MFCNNCGELDHWERSCPKSKIVSTPKRRPVIACENCERLQTEIDRLCAKYEMTAEEKLARIQEQRRKASGRYREKKK